MVALGLVDGAIIIIDLILGVEKIFVEKHPGEITTMSFWEDKVLMSGSIDGRVNVCDIEAEIEVPAEAKSEKRVLRNQNC